MSRVLRKKKIIAGILIFACAVLLGRGISQSVSGKVAENVVVVDAGHGGSDPGKIGVNHTIEKEVNLAIAKLVKKELEKSGVKVVMTREADSGLTSKTLVSTKVEDMKERVRIINQANPEITVSIHQNSYQESSVHGAQVFYFTHSKAAEDAALIMQERLREVDKGNTRQAKANDTYFMLKKTEVPTIIVECGFLSNREDAEKLVKEEYQKQMAEKICEGILEYIEKQE